MPVSDHRMISVDFDWCMCQDMALRISVLGTQNKIYRVNVVELNQKRESPKRCPLKLGIQK